MRALRKGLWLLSFVAASAFAEVRAYPEREEVRAFVARMVEKHGFDAEQLLQVFGDARFDPTVIKLVLPPRDASIRSWRTYRSRFIDADRITGGLRFWEMHRDALREAEERYAVPAEIIVAIIGVETIYGRNTGGFSTLSALTTLAFDYPPRSELFTRELEELLLLARERGRDPRSFRGSYAGALGIPQFLPSSYRSFGIDFDGNGEVDLAESARDAIGSVANFLHRHGWVSGASIAAPARIEGADVVPLIEAGILPQRTVAELAEQGVRVELSNVVPDASEKAALIDLVTPNAATEYWLGFQNFYVITRYNRSSFYAMTVHQLARDIAAAQRSREAASRSEPQ